jgi:hypothetical protein
VFDNDSQAVPDRHVPAPSVAPPYVAATGRGGRATPVLTAEIEKWRSTAARELARHRPVDGLCRACGAVWPCATCQRAEFALGSC